MNVVFIEDLFSIYQILLDFKIFFLMDFFFIKV